MQRGLYKWAKWIKASHCTAMCADQKKGRQGGKIRGGNKSMSWIIQWLGCTPKVSVLWPLWQEVKGSATGKMELTCLALIHKLFVNGNVNWDRIFNSEHTLKPEIAWVKHTQIPHSVCLSQFYSRKLPNLPRRKRDLWPPTGRMSHFFSYFNNMCCLITKSMHKSGQCIYSFTQEKTKSICRRVRTDSRPEKSS